jgi:hypothetical protein
MAWAMFVEVAVAVNKPFPVHQSSSTSLVISGINVVLRRFAGDVTTTRPSAQGEHADFDAWRLSGLGTAAAQLRS